MAKRQTSAERNLRQEIERATEFKRSHQQRAALKPLTSDEAFEAGEAQQVHYHVYRMAEDVLRAKRDEASALTCLTRRIEDAQRNLEAGRSYSSDPIQNAGAANTRHAVWCALAEHAHLLAHALGYYLPELMSAAELAKFERERALSVVCDDLADCWRLQQGTAGYLGMDLTGLFTTSGGDGWQPLAYAEEWLAWRARAAYVMS